MKKTPKKSRKKSSFFNTLKNAKNPENPENPENAVFHPKTCTNSPEVKIVLPDWQSGEDYFQAENSCFFRFWRGSHPLRKPRCFSALGTNFANFALFYFFKTFVLLFLSFISYRLHKKTFKF